MIVGYARVSTDGQTLDAQQAALAAAGAEKVFAEKISGCDGQEALAKAIAALGPGDVLLVTRLDRLARSSRDLLNVLDTVAKAGVGFRSLADAWADTTTPHGRLMLTVLGGLAEFERELIRARTDEGRKRAHARGVQFGGKRKLTPHQRAEAIARRAAGEAFTEIGRSYNVSHSTNRAVSPNWSLPLSSNPSPLGLGARMTLRPSSILSQLHRNDSLSARLARMVVGSPITSLGVGG